MEIYTALIYILLNLNLYTNVNFSKYRLFETIPVLLLIIFYGLRTSSSGADTSNYINIIQTNSFDNYEFLTRLIYKFLHDFFANRHYSIILTLLYLPIFLSFYSAAYIFTGNSKKYTWLILLTCLVSYEYFDFYANIIRNGLAISVCILGLSIYYKYNSFFLTTLFIVVGLLIHGSSVIYLASLILVASILKVWPAINKAIAIFNIATFVVLVAKPTVFSIGIISSILPILENILTTSNGINKIISSIIFSEKSIVNSILDTSILYRISLFATLFPALYLTLINKNDRGIAILTGIFNFNLLYYLAIASSAYSYRTLYLSLALVPYIFILGYKTKLFQRHTVLLYTTLLTILFAYKTHGLKYELII